MTARGELRVHLGAASGAGATCAALAEAHRRAERGDDVVVGVVATHGRPHAAALLDGLEIVTSPGGLDVDAVLARAPRVVVVDELARWWRDVGILVDAGIDVLTTVRIAQLSSLADVVAAVTGTAPVETVPDGVVRRADEVVLVDVTPEELHRRVADGDLHTDIDAALAHAFAVPALVALRELALRWVADGLGHRTGDARWETRERIVVALAGGPGSETVLRRAARIAGRAGPADLLAVHVLRRDGRRTARDVTAPDVTAPDVTTLRRVAEDLGATFHVVVGDTGPDGVATALLDVARGADATQLVLGASRRSRSARLLDPGTGARVLRGSGRIDVHLVPRPAPAGAPRLPVPRGALPASRRTAGWVLAVLAPAAATAVGVALRGVIGLPTDVVAFFLAVVVVALVGGLGPALLAALLAGFALNFFLTPPLYSLTIDRTENLVALVAMLVVAVLVALVVDAAARRAEQASRARAEAALLASFARTLLGGADPLRRLLDEVRSAFGLRTVALLERGSSGWEPVATSGPPDGTRPGDADIDVAVADDLHLTGTGRTLPASDRGLLETVGDQALVALRGQRAAAEAERAARRAEVNETRGALLSAVGHDLRSPLTSIKASAGTLRDPVLRLSDADRAELLAGIEESADRLTGLVANLLDSSRLAAGAVTPLLAPVGYEEVAVAALDGLEGVDRVRIEIDEQVPDVLADAGLLERVVANVVDNALRHGGGTPVTLRASAHAGRVELRVVDRGPGVPVRDLLFTPFQRLGDRDVTAGIGLGLSVARGLAAAMGGTLTAEDTPGGGLTAVVSLPDAAGAS